MEKIQTTFKHFHRLSEPAIKSANAAGDITVTEHLATGKLGSVVQPVTCTLYPRNRGTGEYLFELSPQLGCVAKCNFCGCGPLRGNLSPEEVVEEIQILKFDAIENGIEIKNPKVSFADGGELLMNPQCAEILDAVCAEAPGADIKISSVMPDFPVIRRNLKKIIGRDVAMQISVVQTAGVRQFPFEDIRKFAEEYTLNHPRNRKITLTFTLTNDTVCLPSEINSALPPDLFIIRLHPYRPNGRNLQTIDPVKNRSLAEEFRSLGYKVILEEYDQFELAQLITGGTLSIRNKVESLLK